MAFTSNNEYQSICIKATGELEARLDRIIFEDGVELTRVPKRELFTPDMNIPSLPNKVRQIAQLVWTPAVVAAWNAAHPPTGAP